MATGTNASRFAVLAFTLIATVLLTGCGRRAGGPPDDWESDVLLASECGLEGMRCCADDPCQYGLSCCGDPADPSRRLCARSCACGAAGSFCCADEPRCGEALGCGVNGFCQTCGQKDQPCCNGLVCDGELVCGNGLCTPCGLPGAPCCLDGSQCENEHQDGSDRTECRAGTCVFCGSDGRIACAGEPFCASRHRLNNGDCLRCGGQNEPCCDGDGPLCTEGLNCKLGFCTDL